MQNEKYLSEETQSNSTQNDSVQNDSTLNDSMQNDSTRNESISLVEEKLTVNESDNLEISQNKDHNDEIIYVEFDSQSKCHFYPINDLSAHGNHWPAKHESDRARTLMSDPPVLVGIRFVTTRQRLLGMQTD